MSKLCWNMMQIVCVLAVFLPTVIYTAEVLQCQHDYKQMQYFSWKFGDQQIAFMDFKKTCNAEVGYKLDCKTIKPTDHLLYITVNDMNGRNASMFSCDVYSEDDYTTTRARTRAFASCIEFSPAAAFMGLLLQIILSQL